jgi:two-component system, chemotaxis family, chemotaxis protein CheY
MPPSEVALAFLVVEGSQTVREALCYVLLSFGVKGIPAADKAAALSAVGTAQDLQGAIVDLDTAEVEGQALLQELKADDRYRGLPVIVHTAQSSKGFVLKMVEAGVAGYLLKPFNEGAARAKLAGILDRLADHNTQRRHIRVKPDPEELIRVHFRMPGSSPLHSGKLLDVSLGGTAVELLTPPAPEVFSPGTRIPSLKFSLGPRELSPGAVVVMCKAKVLALRFETLAPADMTALERYIFKRISA